jgi:hypothetical protein
VVRRTVGVEHEDALTRLTDLASHRDRVEAQLGTLRQAESSLMLELRLARVPWIQIARAIARGRRRVVGVSDLKKLRKACKSRLSRARGAGRRTKA